MIIKCKIRSKDLFTCQFTAYTLYSSFKVTLHSSLIQHFLLQWSFTCSFQTKYNFFFTSSCVSKVNINFHFVFISAVKEIFFLFVFFVLSRVNLLCRVCGCGCDWLMSHPPVGFVAPVKVGRITPISSLIHFLHIIFLSSHFSLTRCLINQNNWKQLFKFEEELAAFYFIQPDGAPRSCFGGYLSMKVAQL